MSANPPPTIFNSSPLDIGVPRAFRELVLDTYPLLRTHPKAKAYRGIVQYVLFATFLDNGSKELVLPCGVLAEIVGENIGSHRFNASLWIQDFSRNVFPLHDLGYDFLDGKARTVRPLIPDEIARAKSEMLKDSTDKVGFVSGLPISRRKRHQYSEQQEERLRSIAEKYLRSRDPAHPVSPLAEYLNNNHGCQLRIQKKNWPMVEASIHALPDSSGKEKRVKEDCIRLLYGLDGGQKLFYLGSSRSPRLSVIGTSIHLLPRKIRKLALSGRSTWECDLKSSQLAVVAKQWDIPPLQEFLQSSLDGGYSIWDELSRTAEVPLDICKPILKTTIYSTVFGMGEDKLAAQLALGTEKKHGIGQDAARRVLSHPLIREVLKKRRIQMRLIEENGGAEDAWGYWQYAPWDNKTNAPDVPSALAYCVQSWEMRVMLSLLPVFKAEEQIHCLSWLHDGVTLHLGNRTKTDEHLHKIRNAVNTVAWALSFATALDIVPSPHPTAP